MLHGMESDGHVLHFLVAVADSGGTRCPFRAAGTLGVLVGQLSEMRDCPTMLPETHDRVREKECSVPTNQGTVGHARR